KKIAKWQLCTTDDTLNQITELFYNGTQWEFSAPQTPNEVTVESQSSDGSYVDISVETSPPYAITGISGGAIYYKDFFIKFLRPDNSDDVLFVDFVTMGLSPSVLEYNINDYSG